METTSVGVPLLFTKSYTVHTYIYTDIQSDSLPFHGSGQYCSEFYSKTDRVNCFELGPKPSTNLIVQCSKDWFTNNFLKLYLRFVGNV